MARAGICTKNTEKNTPARNSGTPREYPKNTPKIPKMRIFGILGVFLGYSLGGILGINSGSPEFRAGGVFFSVFFVEVPARAISGLCSRSGRSQIWKSFFWTIFTGPLTHITAKQAEVRANFSRKKKVRVHAVFFGISGFLVGLLGLFSWEPLDCS